MSETKRPREVVVIDAENPLSEIRGEFFWREDHERALADAREASYREGYQRGYEAGASRDRTGSVRIRVVRRRRLVTKALICLAAMVYLVLLVASFVR